MIDSKLPGVGTTIFTRMSALANQHKALNLSQGFPDFDAPQALLDAMARHVLAGHNQYAPMPGVMHCASKSRHSCLATGRSAATRRAK